LALQAGALPRFAPQPFESLLEHEPFRHLNVSVTRRATAGEMIAAIKIRDLESTARLWI
jgi:hypothetical protein